MLCVGEKMNAGSQHGSRGFSKCTSLVLPDERLSGVLAPNDPLRVIFRARKLGWHANLCSLEFSPCSRFAPLCAANLGHTCKWKSLIGLRYQIFLRSLRPRGVVGDANGTLCQYFVQARKKKKPF